MFPVLLFNHANKKVKPSHFTVRFPDERIYQVFFPTELPCNAGLDIAILLDQSNSMLVHRSYMDMAIGFLKDLISNFNPGEDLDHFGLITFK